jgi:hypothetical protein
MKFKDIYKLIDCKFELYFKGSYIGEYNITDSISNIDWTLECEVKSIDIDEGILGENPILSIELS